jgi:hypothetical protein
MTDISRLEELDMSIEQLTESQKKDIEGQIDTHLAVARYYAVLIVDAAGNQNKLSGLVDAASQALSALTKATALKGVIDLFTPDLKI